MASGSSTRKNPRPRFSKEEDRIIIHEVYATKAFCATKNASELYAQVANTLKHSTECQGEVTGKSVRDRFFRLVSNFRTSDQYKRSLSGTSENVTEEDKIMASMVSAIDDIAEEKEAVRQADELKKSKQKQADEAVLDYALNRQRSKKKRSIPGIVTAEDEDENNLPQKTIKTKKTEEKSTGEFSEFIAMVKSGEEAEKKEKEEARKERERERQFEREEREKDRQSRHDELKTILDSVLKIVKK